MKMKVLIILLLFPSLCFAQEERKEKVIIVDLNKLMFQAIDEGGNVIIEGKAVGGRKWCPDIKRRCATPSGEFRVLVKRGPWYRSPLYPLGCNNKSKTNKCARMAYYMKFKHSGEGLHGHDELPDFNASHGCIRLSNEHAEWLSKNFVEIGTKVIILPY
jgi:lipoprotein-anchoring transpeptidase ErfK/SrfK